MTQRQLLSRLRSLTLSRPVAVERTFTLRCHVRGIASNNCNIPFENGLPVQQTLCSWTQRRLSSTWSDVVWNAHEGEEGGLESKSGEEDTIFALSSGSGRCGVAVIRASGPRVQNIIAQMTVSSNMKRMRLPSPRQASRRFLVHPVKRQVLDDALILHFPGPNSYTGEDVVEFHVHGGRAVVNGVLDALSSIENVRPADPGEFTHRAFDNDKLDLTEVEALQDLLAAETEAQRAQALRQLSGELGELYDSWRDELVKCLAHTEALIDFGEDEDDVTDAAYEQAIKRAAALRSSIERHMKDGNRGEILRDGLRIAILGPPNAGKSSLLNVLAKRPAAIVSPIPGTTRDVVDVALNLSGYPVIFHDTAGIRETDCDIEREGVIRAREKSADANLKVAVFDLDELIKNPSTTRYDQLLPEITSTTLIVLNKIDLLFNRMGEDEAKQHFTQALGGKLAAMKDIYVISCSSGAGVDNFIKALATEVTSRLTVEGQEDAPLITRARHRAHLENCLDCLNRFVEQPMQVDLAAEELREATQHLGRITGRVDVEDMLDVVFKDFCIGK